MLALRDELLRRRGELVALVSADMGKTLADADGEVGRGIESVESAAAIPHLLKGETLEGVAAGVDVEMVRQPVGVVAAITPFNFPAMIPLWFLPYAIACGNAFVLKPSELDPRPAALIVEMVDSVEEIPPGVVNLVHGGRDAVTAILEEPGDRRGLLRRPGGDGADRRPGRGRDRQARAGARRGQELARRDAGRRPRAGAAGDHGLGLRRRRAALPGGIGLRLVGDEERHGELREALVARRRGPRRRRRARSGDRRLPDGLRRGPREGRRGDRRAPRRTAPSCCSTAAATRGPAGTRARPDDRRGRRSRVRARPRRALRPAADGGRGRATSTQALEFLNGSRYGNAGAIFTRSGAAARAYRYGAEAGMLGVNVGVPAPVAWFPFSGWKDSIDGDLHANGSDAVDFYTRKKVVTSRW